MGKLIIISGPSGVGKGTIIKNVYQKLLDEGRLIHLSHSYTTREPREGEVDGVDYHFISEQTFVEMIKSDAFLEYNIYANGKYYGTSKERLSYYLVNGYDVILEIDVNGYLIIKDKIRNIFADVPIQSIFIMPPSYDELERRLRNRDRKEKENVIRKRLDTAENELKLAWIYDDVIVNDDLATAITEVAEAMKKKVRIR